MSHESEDQSEFQTQDQVAGAAFFIGGIASLVVFSIFLDDRITSSWGDWIGQGLALTMGIVAGTLCLLPTMSSKPRLLRALRHASNGIMLIASVWGSAAAAAYWGSERLSSAVWLMSLGGCVLLHKLFTRDRNLGCWGGLYLAFFIVGALAAVIEIVNWD